MKKDIVTRRFLTVICLSIIAAGPSHGVEAPNEPSIRFQWLNIDPSFEAARMNAVGKAIDFQNWAQPKARYVAPVIDKSLLSHPELITQELTTYHYVYFGETPWGKCKWSCRRLTKSSEPLPTELPADWQRQIRARLSKERPDDPNFIEEFVKRTLERYRESKRYHLEGAIDVRICLAPSARAAQEYLLNTMTQNTMPTELVILKYAGAKRPEELGTISFFTESRRKDDIRVKFVRNNICLNIRADGCFAAEVLPLARKIDGMLLEQRALTYEQLLSRRPIISIGPEVDTTTTEGQAIIPYDISVPAGQAVISVQAFVDGQHPTAKGGKIYLNVRRKRTRFTVKVTAITSELLVNTFERELIIPE